MKCIVQKFGGSSLKDDVSRKEARKHIVAAVSAGYKVIVVVSAIGRKGAPYATDSLLSLVGNESSHLSPKELDALVSVGETISASVFTELLLASGINAVFMTGQEAGIITNRDFGNAKVETINTERIYAAFKEHDVVVVTGFQGVTEDGSITTLGRGGSDTTAALLGAAFHTDYIDIFTDVNGMMTADPRLVEEAEYIESISYEEVANMAHNGAKVIHPRAVEIAMQAGVPLRIRATYEPITSLGTLVTRTELGVDHYRLVTGIAHVAELTQFTISADNLVQVKLLQQLSAEKISIDFINLNEHEVIFNLPLKESLRVRDILAEKKMKFNAQPDCAKISVVGAGIAGVPGVVYQIAETMQQENIPIYQAADSHTTIWILVAQENLKSAVNALHHRFFNTDK